MSNKYIPPHRRRTQTRSSDLLSNIRAARPLAPNVIFFGDSFVRLFSLLESSNAKVQAFKGASAKGIWRKGNANRTSILQLVQRLRPGRAVLCFGNVDVHLSYYYTKYTSEGSTIDLEAVARDYVEFAANLPVKEVYVVGVYPAAVHEEHAASSLRAYHAIPDEIEIPREDLCIRTRQHRVQAFNKILHLECDRHGISFDSTYSDMVDSRTCTLKPTFQDISPYNIHVVWETTILVWLERWPWLRQYAQPGFQEKIQSSLEDYLRTKPWAKTTHIAADIGVGEAFDIARTEM
jgi:hypothetical protein